MTAKYKHDVKKRTKNAIVLTYLLVFLYKQLFQKKISHLSLDKIEVYFR